MLSQSIIISSFSGFQSPRFGSCRKRVTFRELLKRERFLSFFSPRQHSRRKSSSSLNTPIHLPNDPEKVQRLHFRDLIGNRSQLTDIGGRLPRLSVGNFSFVKFLARCYARLNSCHRGWVGNSPAPDMGWLLESIKRVAGEGEETEEVKIKRPGAVRPGEDKET